MESIKTIKWCVEYNSMRGCLNNFVLFVYTQIVKNEVNDAGMTYEHSELGYVLIVKDLIDGRKGYCTFHSLEDTMFFINHSLVICESIVDIKKLYNGFCISQEVIDGKGYTS